MRSAEEAFEYEAHLRRSLSSRTARGANGTVEPARRTPTPQILEQPTSINLAPYELGEVLTPPRPAFIMTSRHTPHSSTSTEGTVRGETSPASTRDGLGSMMFVMGGGGKQAQEAKFPLEVEENSGSEWETPAKGLHREPCP